MCPVDVVGADCRPFLSRLVANDVAKLQVSGKALYSAMLNDAGHVIDDLIRTRACSVCSPRGSWRSTPSRRVNWRATRG